MKEKLLIVSFAFIPDIPVILTYLFIGRTRGRILWIPENSDWNGIRILHPWWSALWEVPHSILFFAAIVVPLTLYMNWPRLALASYASHIVLDTFTHTGEWGLRLFFPFRAQVNGFTDVWAWPLHWIACSWVVLIALIILIGVLHDQRPRPEPGSRSL